jgi:hypothetical protein
MEVSGQLHTLAALPPGEEPLVPIGWMGPRAILDAVVKREILSPCWESKPRTPIVQPRLFETYKNEERKSQVF